MAKGKKLKKRVGIRKLVRAARAVKDRGEEVNAVNIMLQLADDMDADDLKGFDWDGLLDFIERLIPLIVKLIDLFS